MTRNPLSPSIMAALAIIPVLVVMVTFFAILPWLDKQSDALVWIITIPTATGVVIWSSVMSWLARRSQDEVERAGERYAIKWGMLGGSAIVALILCIPPAHDLIVAAASNAAIWLKGTDEKATIISFVFGVATLAAAQGAASCIANIYWWRSKR